MFITWLLSTFERLNIRFMKHAFILLFTLLSYIGVAQEVVEWEFDYNADTEMLEMKATILPGWHLYSQELSNEIGPVPTSFTFEESEDVELIGKVKEPESEKAYDENFEGELNFFKDEVVFTQQVNAKDGVTVAGTVTFMVCNDRKCLPPTDLNFEITIN